jgi:hypothetical protein
LKYLGLALNNKDEGVVSTYSKRRKSELVESEICLQRSEKPGKGKLRERKQRLAGYTSITATPEKLGGEVVVSTYSKTGKTSFGSAKSGLRGHKILIYTVGWLL